MKTDESLLITRSLLTERLQYHTPNNYNYLYGIMKGIALAVAADVILKFPDNPAFWSRVSLWFASLGAVLVSHLTTARGTLITSFRMNILDSILPIALGLLEFILFGVLGPSSEHPNRWHMWWFIFAGHAFVAACLVANRWHLTLPDDYDAELKDIASDLSTWLRKNLIGAGFVCVGALAFGRVALILQFRERTHTVLGLVAAILMAWIVFEAEKERKHIVCFINSEDVV